MNWKAVGGVLGVIASLAGIGSFVLETRKGPDDSKPPAQDAKPVLAASAAPSPGAVQQVSMGDYSPNVANVQGNVSINIQPVKSKLDIPSFDFSLEPFPGFRRDSKLGEKFNLEMPKFLDKTVYLSVTLSQKMTEDVKRPVDEYNRIIFTVKDDVDEAGTGGSEYLVHLSKGQAKPIEFRGGLAVLSGYFKVYDINGPRQGFMSINLRPVKVE